jgi:hypothetical protein
MGSFPEELKKAVKWNVVVRWTIVVWAGAIYGTDEK